jgi:hypothetical protein
MCTGMLQKMAAVDCCGGTAAVLPPCAKPMLLVRLLRPLALTVAAPLGETVELRGGVVMPRVPCLHRARRRHAWRC